MLQLWNMLLIKNLTIDLNKIFIGFTNYTFNNDVKLSCDDYLNSSSMLQL